MRPARKVASIPAMAVRTPRTSAATSSAGANSTSSSAKSSASSTCAAQSSSCCRNAETRAPRAPLKRLRAPRNDAAVADRITSATASAWVRSSLPFRKARRVNSPGSALRAPSFRSALTTVAATKPEP